MNKGRFTYDVSHHGGWRSQPVSDFFWQGGGVIWMSEQTPENWFHPRASCVMSHVCHVSCVTCHMSCVMCHMSPVTCHVNIFFFLPFGWASGWRACYQRGLFRIVCLQQLLKVLVLIVFWLCDLSGILDIVYLSLLTVFKSKSQPPMECTNLIGYYN